MGLPATKYDFVIDYWVKIVRNSKPDFKLLRFVTDRQLCSLQT